MQTFGTLCMDKRILESSRRLFRRLDCMMKTFGMLCFELQ